MSSRRSNRRAALKIRASVFAALGAETRLELIEKISTGPPLLDRMDFLSQWICWNWLSD